ncbi:hypothetical protein DEM34_10200 [Spiribacter halobius]|uniref:Polysaccharide chain length determinant N-terminal domain-containing protein n=2 Tax=Sediminicurvatus halobius TaxID=2182432 RepID=A0A2U2N1F8_9GAMM|nr:hypothetical protein DEM34_10200 [Spiribacter halobius]
MTKIPMPWGQHVTEDDQRGTPSTARREEMLADDEISLFDLWDVLMDRKWVVLGVFVLVVLASGLYALSRPDTVSLRAVVALGQVGRDEQTPLPDAATVVDELNRMLIPQRMREADGGLATPAASVSSAPARLVELTVEAPAAGLDAHRTLLADVADALLAHQQRQREALLAPARERRERLAEDAATMEETIAALRERMAGMREAQSAVGIGPAARIAALNAEALILQELSDLRRERREVLGELAELEQETAAVSPARLVTEPAVTARGSEPSAGLILALGVVLGGMLGIFAAFFWEFVARANEHRRERGTARH